jgi:superfamily II DNA or RNA helicase
MKFKVIEGKNFKNFIYILDVKTSQDFEIYEIIKKVLSRSEYFPFMTGFNKTISYTYLFNEYIFPVQFWPDVKKQVSLFNSEICILENEELMYQNDMDREDFDNWLNKCKFPDEITTDSENYLYQRDSVFLAVQNKIGRIEVATSGGKTFITYLYCRYLFEHFIHETKKFLIVVPSKVLANQLKSDFLGYDKFFERHLIVETIFAGSKKIMEADIICGTFQSLGNYEQEYFDEFGVFICDETHRAKAYTIRNEIFAKLLNCEYYFAMTGTMPKYKTLDYLHIVSMFGDELVKRTAAENIRDGVSTPIKINAIQIKYLTEDDYSENLIESGIVGIEKFRAEKEFFHSYDKRTKLIAKLLNAFTGNSLILVDTVEYCSILFDFLNIECKDSGWEFYIIHGEVKNREEIIDGMRQTKDHYCIIATYGTMSTGVSIKNIEYIYFPDGGKSEIRIRQSLGRGMRLFPNKEYCVIFDFQDQIQRCAFRNHSRERMRIYHEQGFPVKITKVEI